MTPNEYQQLAMRTQAPTELIRERWMNASDEVIQLETAFRGLADEVGEIASNLKSHIEYGKEFDRTNMKEEVGDLLWRIAQICQASGFTVEEAMEANIRKLKKRYPYIYSDHLAAEENRDRKAEAEAIADSGVAGIVLNEDDVEIVETFESESSHFLDLLETVIDDPDLSRSHEDHAKLALKLRMMSHKLLKMNLTA